MCSARRENTRAECGREERKKKEKGEKWKKNKRRGIINDNGFPSARSNSHLCFALPFRRFRFSLRANWPNCPTSNEAVAAKFPRDRMRAEAAATRHFGPRADPPRLLGYRFSFLQNIFAFTDGPTSCSHSHTYLFTDKMYVSMYNVHSRVCKNIIPIFM